jgi:DNA-binding transcriptional ArsR family regulator
MAALLLDDPRALLERFLNTLERYGREAFEEEWARLEPELAAGVSEAGHQIEQRGLYGMFRGLWPKVRSDPRAERLWPERPHDHEVAVGPDDTLLLAPAPMGGRTYASTATARGPSGSSSPSPRSSGRPARGFLPRNSSAHSALADDTRLRALRLLAERPRSTQELAPLVGISEAALSKHLRVLADVGLLERRREGHDVLYRLARGQVAGLTPSLESFLHTATAR